ncbi:sensor histidine kinase [Ancylobacter mangrovi]|uniref:sensor histidine kinase n=1 Tax=Ancylobacter mangrovi TaxID=2972472 RepID=UPI002163A96D|nr:HAMP domain-containing sensor histidine kinase [Ancylobacter mangrovi]MCS0504990.1 HAMP domain-containing histidine kinase [Ancylobacter mangrovi]
MNAEPPARRRSQPLVRIVAGRIVLFAAIAMLAQLVAVLVEYGRDPQNLARLLLERETAELAGGLSLHDGRLAFDLPSDLASRYGVPASGYFGRIRTASGVVLFSHCDEECTEHFLPLEFNPPSFWMRTIRPGYPLTFAGGREVDIGERSVLVEIAVLGDRQHAVWSVLANEALDHMLLPMSLTLIFVLGATLASIRTALRPVAAAAGQAERFDPLVPDSRLDEAGMPLEIARLAGAVNRSYARTRELMAAQKLFTSAIAHEIRTPLAIIRMELERIDHPAARQAIGELDELDHFVGQLVMLARLEAADRSGFERVDLDELGRDIVGALAPYVYDHGAIIAFDASSSPSVLAHPPLLKDAVRNLIENAVRHGGPSVHIRVGTDNGPGLFVEDDGVGFAPASREVAASDAPGHYRRAGGLGIGLEIVRRIMALHGGHLETREATPCGARARLVFPPAGEAPVTPAR